ncbi:MAG: CDP-alcohol phosphatidyltransferase family protein [Thermoproteota archaeon]|nr:CDP-alcohol phosphatidyltransferase family protein [Thermoproteota archaeon]
MLNKLREKINPLSARMGTKLGSLGFSPTFWSTVGFVMAIASALSFGLSDHFARAMLLSPVVIGSIFLLISGFFDIIDGSVARSTNKSTAKGSFIDSTYDKLAEIIVFIGISVGGLSNPVICLIAISMSMMVSYSRAKAESLGIDLRGIGLGERAERLLVISLMGLIPISNSVEIGTIIVSLLSSFTFLQRLHYTLKKLKN